MPVIKHIWGLRPIDGPILGELWKDIVQSSGSITDAIEIPAEPDLHVGFIHVDDVAAAFHAVVDRITAGLLTGV
jgi:hypothetical protein